MKPTCSKKCKHRDIMIINMCGFDLPLKTLVDDEMSMIKEITNRKMIKPSWIFPVFQQAGIRP
jgi:hypothetical protein